MPAPAPYVPTYDFASDAAPVNKINAAALQQQLALIGSADTHTSEYLRTALRPDGTLTDALVRVRNLHAELVTYIQSAISGTIATRALVYRLPVKQAIVVNHASFIGIQTFLHGDRLLLVAQTNAVDNGLWIVQAVGTIGNLTGQWLRASDLPAGSRSSSGWAVISRQTGLPSAPVYIIVAGGADSATPLVGTDTLQFSAVLGDFPVQVIHGGTGAITAAQARVNLDAAAAFTFTITGNGVANSFNIATSIVSASVDVTIVTGGRQALADWFWAAGIVIVLFVDPPPVGEVFTVTVVG